MSVKAYQSQLLHNDSNAITKMGMYEMEGRNQGKCGFDFPSSRLQGLQRSPELSPKAARLWTKISLFIGTQTD